MRFDGSPTGRGRAASAPVTDGSGASRRTGWLPFAAVRPDYELIQVNGRRLELTGCSQRVSPVGSICAVTYRAELRPTTREVLSHLVTPHAGVVSRSRIIGGASIDEYEAAGSGDAAWSMESATAAAAQLLGEQVHETGTGAVIDALRDDTLGLRIAEVITAVDGNPVRTASELRAELAGRHRAELTVSADGVSGGRDSRRVTLTRHADGAWGVRVVTAERRLSHGIAARFDLPGDLRGPSLGLSCALSIVDAFTGGRMAAAGTVVATGTVDLAGRVGAVGAIEYKARAAAAHADVRRFMLPAESIADVEAARRVLGGRVEVVAVTTLAEAVEILCGPGWRSVKTINRSADRRMGTVL
jgi:PDZ domain-containing protein